MNNFYEISPQELDSMGHRMNKAILAERYRELGRLILENTKYAACAIVASFSPQAIPLFDVWLMPIGIQQEEKL